MNAIRRDEDMDNLHSIYVDQWDWEKVITREDAHCGVPERDRSEASWERSVIRWSTSNSDISADKARSSAREVSFVTTQELEDMYPAACPQGAGEHVSQGARDCAFIMQIGDLLKSR